MLPFISAKTRAAAVVALTSLSIALPAAPALAWGQRERDTLKGAVGALVLKAIIDDARRDRAQVYQPAPPPPVYYQPNPGYVHARPRAQVHSIYSTPAAHAFNSYSSAERRLIQRRLAYWGYYRGAVDGSFGPGTYSAVLAYARDQGYGGSLGSTAGAFGVYDGLIY
jgi:hypothetical protein